VAKVLLAPVAVLTSPLWLPVYLLGKGISSWKNDSVFFKGIKQGWTNITKWSEPVRHPVRTAKFIWSKLTGAALFVATGFNAIGQGLSAKQVPNYNTLSTAEKAVTFASLYTVSATLNLEAVTGLTTLLDPLKTIENGNLLIQRIQNQIDRLQKHQGNKVARDKIAALDELVNLLKHVPQPGSNTEYKGSVNQQAGAYYQSLLNVVRYWEGQPKDVTIELNNIPRHVEEVEQVEINQHKDWKENSNKDIMTRYRSNNFENGSRTRYSTANNVVEILKRDLDIYVKYNKTLFERVADWHIEQYKARETADGKDYKRASGETGGTFTCTVSAISKLHNRFKEADPELLVGNPDDYESNQAYMKACSKAVRAIRDQFNEDYSGDEKGPHLTNATLLNKTNYTNYNKNCSTLFGKPGPSSDTVHVLNTADNRSNAMEKQAEEQRCFVNA
jgi:hypothetical protein